MKKIVGIIGGKGKCGSQFAGIFKKIGFAILVSDLGTEMSNSELIKRADIVLFSVPLHLSEKVILKEIKNLRKDQIVMDVSSLKSKQVSAMNKGVANVIGMHPLFGPNHKKVKGLTIVICKGKCERKAYKFICGIFKKAEFKIAEMTPEEHDKAMALIQVIPHLKTIISGELIKFLGIKPDALYKIGTPIYKVELSIIGRIFSQDAALYSAIISENPFSKRIAKFLEKISLKYSDLISKGDISGLNSRFLGVKKFLGGFEKKAFKDSEKIINNLEL